MVIDEVTMEKLKEWADKSPLTLEELEDSFEQHYEQLKEEKPGKDDKFYIPRARFMVKRGVRGAKRTTAKPVDGIFFGYKEEYDFASRDRAYAEEMYKANPKEAIEQGLTDPNGIVLDPNPQTPWNTKNPNYGKPLQAAFGRQSFGIGRPADGDELKLMVVSAYGDQALVKPPLGKPVRTLLNMRADEEGRRLYNTSTLTKYELIEMDEFGEVDEETICSILADAPEEFRVDLDGLEDWHFEHDQDSRRIVIVEADVSYVAPQPTSTGNYMMIIEDESVDIDDPGTTVWVHPQIAHMLDFGSGSRVFVVASTGMTAFFDTDTREANPDIQVPMLNAVGIWAIPEFRMEKEESFAVQADEEATV